MSQSALARHVRNTHEGGGEPKYRSLDQDNNNADKTIMWARIHNENDSLQANVSIINEATLAV